MSTADIYYHRADFWRRGALQTESGRYGDQVTFFRFGVCDRASADPALMPGR